MVWKGSGNQRLAKSLVTLIDQVDARWPKRDRSSDGTIGDVRHQATKSEHNPDSNGIVRALDVSNDPANGLVARKLAETLVASRDPRILYVISNAQIISSVVQPWVWRPYSGVNAHEHHCHISVVESPALYDDTKPWSLGGAVAPKSAATMTASGKGSWYSQFTGRYVWKDSGDAPGSAALGCPDDAQGVSFYDPATLGKWFEVQAPNGVTSIEQQTDIGPHPNTRRKIDISAAAAERFGYSPKNFPTDAIFSWRSIPVPAAVASLRPVVQATKFRDLRKASPGIGAPIEPATASKGWLQSIADLIFRRGV